MSAGTKPLPDEPLSSNGDRVKSAAAGRGAAFAGLQEGRRDLGALLEKLDESSLMVSSIQELKIVLEQIQDTLRKHKLMSGVLLCVDLAVILDRFDDNNPADGSSSSIVLYALKQLTSYMDAVQGVAHDMPACLLRALNNVRAHLDQRLLTERVFALPVEYSAAKTDSLVSVVPALEADFKATEFYVSFSEILGDLYRNDTADESRAGDLEKLAQLLRASINQSSHEYAAVFWFTCSVFVSCIRTDSRNLMPADKQILRQIDLVIKHFVVDVDTPVLSGEGIESVERILINMLCYIAEKNPDDPIVSKLEQQFETKKSLQQLDTKPASGDGVLLVSSIQSTCRLIASIKLAIDAATKKDALSAGKILDNLSCLLDAIVVLVCAEGACHVESAIDSYRRFMTASGSLSDRDACATALVRAERSMLEMYRDQLATVTHGSGSLSFKDDHRLDQLLVRELLTELKSVVIASDPAPDAAFKSDPESSGEYNPETGMADEELVELSLEWLQVVLSDVISGAAFLSDTFLYEELSWLQSGSDSLSVEVDQALLLQLLVSVKEYCAGYASTELRESAQEQVHVSLEPLKKAVARLPLEQSQAGAVSADIDKHAEPDAIDVDVAEPVNDHKPATSDEIAIVETTHDLPVASVEFGNDCNTQVDIIQHALDTALGSSGNLAPDKTVLSALENLRSSVDKAGLAPLQRLIEPLAQVLSSAESAGSTLSQSDTLLVQEAIVAITLGVDSLVNGKPMSALVDDVAQRMTTVAIDGSHNVRGEYESAGLVDIFVEEAEDLLQRLFELFQRWRGAPRGGSRLHGDICRLLHTIKGSADTVGLNTVATLVHYLESALLGVRGFNDPTEEFFDLVLEAVETLSDDIDRVRNGEQPGDRGGLILKLQAISLAENNVELKPDSLHPSDIDHPADIQLTRRSRQGVLSCRIDRSTERAPAFGSAKYFHALELSERMLTRSSSDSLEQHEKLQQYITEMRSTLQSTRYLLNNNTTSASINKSIEESLSDLESVQRNLSKLAGQIAITDDKRRAVVQDLTALVSSADRVSVDSIRMRMESIVQKSAVAASKLVNFQLLGSELELDRKLFAGIVSPLEQLLTNAVVHGIESKAVRASQGKSDFGIVDLSFQIDKQSLVVCVSDDGAGINIDEVRKRLAGFPELGESSSLSNDEVLANLVVQGVSTAQRTDRASGRGLGLDVVVQSVYAQKGTLAVSTTAGAGTEFKLSIPLLSIPCQVLIVEVAKQFYAIDCGELIEVQEQAGESIALAGLFGIGSAVNIDEQSVVNCQVGRDVVSLRVDSIVGRRTLNFNYHDPVLNGIDWCDGSAVYDGRYVVLKLNTTQLQALKPAASEAGPPVKLPEVLIVDDSVTIRASFGRAMTTAGYAIHLARNGVEAIECLKKITPAVVILDLEMPEMNGFDVAAYIRSESHLDQSKLIIVTSRPRSEIDDWLISVKAEGYFEKPCAEQVLADAVAGLL